MESLPFLSVRICETVNCIKNSFNKTPEGSKVMSKPFHGFIDYSHSIVATGLGDRS